MASHFTILLDRYLKNKASEAERQELMRLIQTGEYEDQIKHSMAGQLHAEMQADQTQIDPILQANDAYTRAQQIIDQILANNPAGAKQIPFTPAPSPRRWWLAAAAVAAMAVIAGYYIIWLSPQTHPHPFTAHRGSSSVKEEVNEGTTHRQVMLDDSTRVTLQPGAHLIYPHHFAAAKREVYLTGEAFFEVTKDATRPFFVYSKTLVTEVVGTSFTVRANSTVQQSEVAVVTGKVSVSQNQEDKTILQRLLPTREPVLLTRNHRAVYQDDTDELVVRLVEKPVLLTAPQEAVAATFRFRTTSLATVLRGMADAYGIEIVAQNSRINQCTFTGDLSEVDDLYTRLELICQSIGASYVIRDATILITGNGC